MSQNRPTALQAEQVTPVSGPAPEPYAALRKGRVKRRLGNAFGLNQFGVNLVTVLPGGNSAMRHWHTHEDEFIYMLSGELVLVTEAGETALSAGMCAGFAAGQRDAHHLLNRSAAEAQYLEIGSRVAGDLVVYPDDDVMQLRDADGLRILHKDGSPYA